MTNTEIKKYCYQKNPSAEIKMIKDGVVHYAVTIEDGRYFSFEIPFKDTAGAAFYDTMPAKLLLRWLVGYTDVFQGSEEDMSNYRPDRNV